MEVNNEKFSGVKFFSGFAQWGKILFILVLFSAFTMAKDHWVPAIRKNMEIKHVETYVEAEDHKTPKFFGLRLYKIAIGFLYD